MKIKFNHHNAAFEINSELNEELLEHIRKHAKANGHPASYLVPGAQLLVDDDDGLVDEDFVVIALPGVKSQSIDCARPDRSALIGTHRDGSRVACLLLAKDSVALDVNAIPCCIRDSADWLLVLWLFEDDIALSAYQLDDDLMEDIWVASQCADEHVHLTHEETFAWQKVAQEEEYIGVFDVFDVEVESPLV